MHHVILPLCYLDLSSAPGSSKKQILGHFGLLVVLPDLELRSGTSLYYTSLHETVEFWARPVDTQPFRKWFDLVHPGNMPGL